MLAYSASDHLQLMRKCLYHWNVHIYPLLLLLSSSLLFGCYTLKWNAQLNGENGPLNRRRWGRQQLRNSSIQYETSIFTYTLRINEQCRWNVEDVRGNHFSASTKRHAGISSQQINFKYQQQYSFVVVDDGRQHRRRLWFSLCPLNVCFISAQRRKNCSCFFFVPCSLCWRCAHAIRSNDFVFAVHLCMRIIIIITIWLHASTSFRGERDYLRCVRELPGSDLFGQ